MSIILSWSIEGEKQLSRILIDLKNNLKDFKPPLTEASKELVATFSGDVFDSQGAAINEKWKRLSPYTLAQKAKKGYSSDPLIATGAMRRGFKSIVETDRATVYNNVDYFKFHQSNKPRKRLPRRVMMKLGETQKTMIVRVFQKHILQSINKT